MKLPISSTISAIQIMLRLTGMHIIVWAKQPFILVQHVIFWTLRLE